MAKNEISTLATKELRQIAKLDLAQTKRQLVGTAGYRDNRYYDIDLLPTKYSGNDVVNNPNVDGLQLGRPWKTTPNTISGLWRSVYNGNFDGDWTWFDSQTPIIEGAVTDFEVGEVIADNRSVQWLGYFRAPHTANYTFWLYSDDSSILWIGDKAITEYADDNWDVYTDAGAGEASTDPIALVAGQYYPIRVQYGNGVGSAYFEFTWEDDYVIPGILIDIDPGNPFCWNVGQVNFLNDLAGSDKTLTLIHGSSGVAPTVVDNYITLDGFAGNYVTAPANFIPWVNGESFTIHYWFKTPFPGSVGILLGQTDSVNPNSAGAYVPAMYIGLTNKLMVSTFLNIGNAQEGSVTVNDGNWHLASVTYANGTQTVYVDGSVDGTPLVGTTQSSYSSTYYYFLGTGSSSGWAQDPTNSYFILNIGAFKVLSSAQTASEVLAYYTSTQANYV